MMNNDVNGERHQPHRETGQPCDEAHPLPHVLSPIAYGTNEEQRHQTQNEKEQLRNEKEHFEAVSSLLSLLEFDEQQADSRPTLDHHAYDADGYNCFGFDREGYDRNGYSWQGFDRQGRSRWLRRPSTGRPWLQRRLYGRRIGGCQGVP